MVTPAVSSRPVSLTISQVASPLLGSPAPSCPLYMTLMTPVYMHELPNKSLGGLSPLSIASCGFKLLACSREARMRSPGTTCEVEGVFRGWQHLSSPAFCVAVVSCTHL